MCLSACENEQQWAVSEWGKVGVRGREELGKEEREGRKIGEREKQEQKGTEGKETEAQVEEYRRIFAELNSNEKQPLGYSNHRLCANYDLRV